MCETGTGQQVVQLHDDDDDGDDDLSTGRTTISILWQCYYSSTDEHCHTSQVTRLKYAYLNPESINHDINHSVTGPQNGTKETYTVCDIDNSNLTN